MSDWGRRVMHGPLRSSLLNRACALPRGVYGKLMCEFIGGWGSFRFSLLNRTCAPQRHSGVCVQTSRTLHCKVRGYYRVRCKLDGVHVYKVRGVRAEQGDVIKGKHPLLCTTLNNHVKRLYSTTNGTTVAL